MQTVARVRTTVGEERDASRQPALGAERAAFNDFYVATRASRPPGMIWVTHDLKPRDFGAPGGEVEMVRMLCFEFPDGSGGSEWPVHPDWRPPIADAQSTETSNSGFPAALLVAGLTAAVLLTVSLVGSEAQRTADNSARFAPPPTLGATAHPPG